MSSGLDAWREVVLARRAQMDAAYAALGRTSADFWDRRAQQMRAVSLRLPEDDPGLRLLRRFTTAASTVLDVGAGAGRYARALAPHVRRVVAVEPNQALVDHLCADAVTDGLTTIEVVPVPWEDAVVEPADLVLCAHVLNPHPEIGPFVNKLDQHTRGVCVLLAMADWGEPPLLLDLWRRFHGTPRVGQPDARHLFDALYDLGIPANVEIAPPVPSTQWTFATLAEALAACREHLILPPDPALDRELTAALTASARQTEAGAFRLDAPPRVLAALWWRADGPRLPVSARTESAHGSIVR